MENITNEKVTKFINSYYIPLNKRLESIRLEAEENFIPIMQRELEEYISSILLMKKPKKILEVGSCIGYSASFMALTCPTAKIVTIEHSQELFLLAQKNLDDFGLLPRVKVILGDGVKVLKELKNQGEKFDFIFVDAGKSHYIEFLDEVLKLVDEDGIILCDNILQRGMTVDDCYDPKGKHKTAIKNMREFISYIKSEKSLQTYILPIGDGITISHYKHKSL